MVCKAEDDFDSSDSEDDPSECIDIPQELGERMEHVPPHLAKLFDGAAHLLDKEQRVRLAGILCRYKDTFVKTSKELGLSNIGQHVINTGDHEPIKERYRRVPLHKKELIEERIKEMLEVGIIRPSESPWSACPVLVTKQDGSVRWCVDWRRLNEITIKDSFPMPRVDECIDALEGAQWFSCIDLQHGYWQIPLRQQDWEKTAFSTHMGLFEFTRTPMGVSNAPATFQRIMEMALNGMDMRLAIIYIDDVVIPGRDFDSAANSLERVLGRLEKANLKVKTKKCHLFQKRIQFLGHDVGVDGIRPVDAKVQKIRDWPVPVNPSKVRGFLGLVGYYRKMIKNFAALAEPLNALLKKDTLFLWTAQCQIAFDALRCKLMEGPIMAFPVADCHYILRYRRQQCCWGGCACAGPEG